MGHTMSARWNVGGLRDDEGWVSGSAILLRGSACASNEDGGSIVEGVYIRQRQHAESKSGQCRQSSDMSDPISDLVQR